MRILHLCYSDNKGGAARAAYRIHRALVNSGEESRMWVELNATGDWTVNGPIKRSERVIAKVRYWFGSMLCKCLNTKNLVLHSPAVFPSRWVSKINESDADIVNLHWTQNEMLSIADISRIDKPLVFTLHDMWAFCGAEHYVEDLRWANDYSKESRVAGESGFDLNRWVWLRKKKHWIRPMQIVTPSKWLATCVAESSLMHSWPVEVIPNALDLDIWRPIDRQIARDLLGLSQDKPLLLFGAFGGNSDPRKGFDLLVSALSKVRSSKLHPELIVFGQAKPLEEPEMIFPVNYLGNVFDDLTLRALYSAADVMLIPSRLDNLPNTAVEALAMGTPVVSFDVGGISDVVKHQINGYLAAPFDCEEFAKGIEWCVRHSKSDKVKKQIRSGIQKIIGAPIVAKRYKYLYQKILEKS